VLISKNKIEIPDSCPEKCSLRSDYLYQGNICSRCPIFNCEAIENHDEIFRLLEPEDYREDWAIEWKRFFDGEIDYPNLKLCIKENHDENE